MKSIYIFFLAVILMNTTVKAQPVKNKAASVFVTGFVFEDKNANGIKDKNEPGIKSVAVSDQVNIVLSNDEGYYKLPVGDGYGIVYISMPDGYETMDSFWRPTNNVNDPIPVNFSLRKTKNTAHFSFVHASDTHISPSSIDRMAKLQRIVDSVNPDFVIITGDLVKDALRVSEKEATGYYELFEKERNKFSSRVWTVPGNHELFGIERHLSLVSSSNPLYGRKMYRHYFGPDYYSFNYGGVHFVGLNSLDFEDLWYYGRIDSTQIEWLKKDIATVSPATPVITFQHVPFYSGGLSLQPFEDSGPGRVIEREKGILQYRHVVSNAQEVMTILNGHNYPVSLAGHYHFQQRFSMAGITTRFEQTAAVTGPSNEGVFNMPSGVTLYTVHEGKVDEGRFIFLDK